ncbi:NUDIX hydrolase [Streptomyces sp. NPDC001914]|uniref:NUDIX hydrolase n=1 Tax=Streptomyces sp. NPDC001914 TaxID=3364623 RepID=UPI0036B57DDE
MSIGSLRDASVVVARDNNDLVALLSADFPTHAGPYLFPPGGRREDGESPLECARRELREETGVSAEHRWARTRSPCSPPHASTSSKPAT